MKNRKDGQLWDCITGHNKWVKRQGVEAVLSLTQMENALLQGLQKVLNSHLI